MASAPLPANDDTDPLSDLGLEESLLGLLMIDNSHVDRAADLLTAADFYDALHGRIFEAIVEAVAQGRPANPATLHGQFVGHPGLLIGLSADPSSWFTPADAAKQLAELSARRQIRDGLMEAATECGNLATPTPDIVTMADGVLASKSTSTVRQSSGADCLKELIESLDRPVEGVLCQHIRALDELHGPIEPSQLVILAARPGMGKTALAISYAQGAAQAGHGVLFASLEMNRQQLAGRMAADLCFDGDSVPYAAIRDRKLNDFQRRRVADAYSKMQAVPFSVVDTGSLTPGRLAMIARRQDRRMRARGHKLELIVVDYLQLLRPDSGTNKPYEAVSEISRSLKAIALDMNVGILALAQLSREVEKRPDKRPQLSDLRDSGQIEQDADSVMFLLRQEYYLHVNEPDPMDAKRAEWEAAMESVKGTIEFILAKKRNGTTGTAVGSFHGAYQAVR